MYSAPVLELDDDEVDPRELARLIDTLQAKLCRAVTDATNRIGCGGRRRGDRAR